MKRSTVPSSPARQILSNLDLNLPPSPPPEPYLSAVEEVLFLSPPILTTPTKFSDQAYPSSSSQSQFSSLFDASFLSTPPSTVGYPTSPVSPDDEYVEDSIAEKRRQRGSRRGNEVQEDAFDRGAIFFGAASKRRKLSRQSEMCQFDTGRKVQGLLPRTGVQVSTFEMNRMREIGLRVKPSHISMRPYLKEFVSHNEREVFRCYEEEGDPAFPFCLAFSKAAKAGRKQIFAVGDCEGGLHIIDGARDTEWHAEGGLRRRPLHQQAIFDVLWSKDDSLIATTSGDHTVGLWDVKKNVKYGQLNGHNSSVKKVDFCPSNPNLLTSCSRDGSIILWDLRSQKMVNQIRNAHGTRGKPSRSMSSTKSVTSVAFLHQVPHLLASSGSFDGVVKIWDLRKSHTRRVNPEEVEASRAAVTGLDLPRSFGISSMVLSPNGQRLYALSMDSKIYAFDPLNLTQPAPLATFSHSKATYKSFFLRCAVSPCSRYLASGSSDSGIYLWDTEGTGQDGVRLLGHEKEVVGLDWGYDKIASASDDYLVRVWNSNNAAARGARASNAERWRWSGADE